MAQAEQPPRQTIEDVDPLTVFAGVFTESALDTLSFGIFSPDIIPEAVEEQHPYATLIGNVTGALSTFAVPMGASRAGAWGLFNFSRKIMGAGKLARGASKAAPFMGGLYSRVLLRQRPPLPCMTAHVSLCDR